LFWSWHRALITHGKQSLERYIVVFLLCLLYAISDEWHQSMVAGRTGRAMDVFFDMQGMGVMLYRLRGYV
jgi:VanZ family protein